MAVLVTGGLGHIGSWVCHDLVKKGYKVIATGRSRRRLSYLEGMEDRLKFVPVDVLDLAGLYRLFVEEKGEIEGVVHIAGLMGGPLFATNPRHHIYTNTMGTVDMLEISRTFGVGRFIYVSSGAVYGVRDTIPYEHEPVNPGDLYGAAKASAEFIGLQYANEFGLDFRAIRVYFAYGPGRLPSELYPM
ncbi:MAG: NAD(P)-dependent oxidoreductase, partial [Syntrophobacteraceae bacterium]